MNLRFPDDIHLGLLILAGLVVAIMLAYHMLSRQPERALGRRSRIVIWSIAAAAALGSLAFLLRPDWRQPPVIFLFLAAISIATVAVFYRLVYRYLGPFRVAGLFGLRALGILGLLLLMFMPELRFAQWGSKPVVAVMFDSSQSMATSDGGAATRYQRSLDAVDAVVGDLSDVYQVNFYRFDAKVRETRDLRDFYDLPPDGSRTDMTLALKDAVMLNPAQRLDAIFMLTDGNHNAPGSPPPSLGSLQTQAEIMLVGVGSKDIAPGGKDLAIDSVEAPEEAIAFNETTITANVRAGGFADKTIKLELKEGGEVLASQEFLVDAKAAGQTVKLSYVPQKVGRRRLTLALPSDPTEVTDQNNRAPLSIFVTDPQIKVLYFERPRPEYRELRRTLDKDRNVELTTCVLIRANEFSVMGTLGGKPVTSAPTAETLKKYDVFIIGSVEQQVLGQERMAAIRDAVKEGKKGLLMLGGTHGLGPGGYGGTALEEAMPVALGRPTLDGGQTRQENGPFLPVLSAPGKAHPIFANLADFFPDEPATTQSGQSQGGLARLLGCVVVDAPKPAAQVLAVHPKRDHLGKPLTVVAVQQYGEGRSAVMTADSTQQWARQRDMQGRPSPYHVFWRQMIRWLASADVKDKAAGASVQIVLDRVYLRQGQTVQIKARVRGADGLPYDEAAVVAEVTLPDGATRPPMVLPRQPGESGWYAGQFEPVDLGEYKLAVTARSPSSAQPLATDAETFSVDAPTSERDQLALNEDLLVKLSRSGRGRYLALSDLPGAVDSLRAEGRRRMQQDQFRIQIASHQLELFLVFIGLVTAEWLLRRHWQLT